MLRLSCISVMPAMLAFIEMSANLLNAIGESSTDSLDPWKIGRWSGNFFIVIGIFSGLAAVESNWTIRLIGVPLVTLSSWRVSV
jgi:hypothetical protein